ncbi:MAG: GLPGLI family protein [Lewinellaceae bacterium]|nr:GLPGLI family protein [Lewinellaceae bacterium]
MDRHLAGLKITVWFALDIPVSAGPERLCGLPGLILEVDINDGALNLVADKLDLQKLTTEMDVPKKLKGKKVTEAEYLDVIAKHVAEKKKNEEPWFWGLRYF